MIDQDIQIKGRFVKTKKDGEKGHFIKGFLSMNGQDREYDILPPEAFDLKSFMQIRTLLYEHKFWLDDKGNKQTAGEVVQANKVKLLTNPDDETTWRIKDLDTAAIIGTFPKDRVPNLVHGDRGIFVVARVDVEKIWDKVKRGVLNGLSWKGAARIIKAKIGKLVKDVVAAVDMYEASVCSSPEQGDSLFVMMTKSHKSSLATDVLADCPDLALQFLAFSPVVFNEDQARAWLKSRKFADTDIFPCTDGELISLQAGKQLFVEDSIYSLKLARGVQAFVGVLDNKKVDKSGKDAILALTEKIVSGTVDLVKEDNMGRKKKVAAEPMEKAVRDEKPLASVEVPAGEEKAPHGDPHPTEAVDVTKVSAPEKIEAPTSETVTEEPAKAEEAVAAEPKAPRADDIAAKAAAEAINSQSPDFVKEKKTTVETPTKRTKDALVNDDVVAKIASLTAQEVSTAVTTKLDGVVGSLQKAVSTLTTTLQQSVALQEAAAKAMSHMLTKQARKVKAQPEVAMAKSKIKEIAEKEKELDSMRDELLRVKGMVTTMAKTAISTPDHDESTAPKKDDMKETDPNAVFGSSWPFTGRHQ